MYTIKSQKEIQEVGGFYKKISEINKEYMNYWLENSLFGFDFWISLSLSIIPWIIWFRVRKMESQGRLLIAGFLMLLLSSWFDFLGVTFGLWYYSVDILPTIPSYLPWDFTILPVLTMLFIQYKPNMNSLKKAIVFSAFNSFLGEPMMELIGLYVPLKWNIFYSFPIYMILYLLCDRLAHMDAYKTIK